MKGSSAAAIGSALSCYHFSISGGGMNGCLGQIGDGQIRIDSGLQTSTFCINNKGQITDGAGRGCIVTGETSQFQCDENSPSLTPGFSMSGQGQLQFNNSPNFYACPATDTTYNIYTKPLKGQSKCVQITLTHSDSCGSQPPSGGSPPGYPPSGSPSAPATYPSKPSPTAPGSYPPGGSPDTPGSYPPGSSPNVPGPCSNGYSPGSSSSCSGGGSPGTPGSYPPGGSPDTPGSYPSGGSPNIPGPCSNGNSPGSSGSCSGGGSPGAPGSYPLGGSPDVPGSYPPGSSPNVPGPCSNGNSPGSSGSCSGGGSPGVPQPCPSGYSPAGPGRCTSRTTYSWSTAYTTYTSFSTIITGGPSPPSCQGSPNPNGPGCSGGSGPNIPTYPSSAPVQSPPAPSNSGPGYPSSAPAQSPPTPDNSAPGYPPSAPAQSPPAPSNSAPGYPSSAPTQSPPAPTNPAPGYPPSGPGSSPPPPPPSLTSHKTACQTELTGAYQTPHLIVPVSNERDDTAFGSQYSAMVTEEFDTIFSFDIPKSYEGMLCSLIFLFPKKSDLETSDYLYIDEGGELNFLGLAEPINEQTTWNNKPFADIALGGMHPVPGESYVIESGPCQAGQRISVNMGKSGPLDLIFFQDWNPSPIGLYVTAC